MSLTMYQASVPVFIRQLHNLSAILTKAVAHADARAEATSLLIEARLAPDMFPLARQIQIASDTAKGAGARLAGVDVPSFEDKETTFPELQERIAKTIAFLEGMPAEKIDGSEDREVVVKTRNSEMRFTGQSCLLTFAL